MDNGGAHKSQKIKDIVKESKNNLLYSVPYRPKTNAIESWFNQFKYYFQLKCSGANTYSQLKVNVKDSIKVTTDWYYKILVEKINAKKVTDQQIQDYMNENNWS